MKTIVLGGMVIGAATLVATFLINFLTISVFPEFQDMYENTAIFRAPDDPLLMLYLVFPFALGLGLAWVWGRVKHLFSGSLASIAWDFSIVFFVVVGIPTFLINTGSFNLPVLMMASWLLTTYVNGYLAGLVLGKLNPP